MLKMTKQRKVQGIAAIGVVGLAGLAAIVGSVVGRSADLAAVERIAEQAVHADHELATLPASAARGSITADTRASMIRSASATLKTLFTGKTLDSRLDTIPATIAAEGTNDGVYIWEGGVSKLDIRESKVDGDTATVIVRATTFLVLSATADGERSRPENTADVTLTLVRLDGRWLVASEDLEFLPGQGP